MTPGPPARTGRLSLPAVLLALAGLCILPPLEAIEDFVYTRDLDVPAAGRVRVPLDIAAIRHMAPEGADLHVFTPEGETLPHRLSTALPESASRPAQLGRPEQVAAGWAWVVDAGEGFTPHERLALSLAGFSGPLPVLNLESSPDADAWSPLVTAVPTPLRRTEGLRRISLAYPATADRHLRLTWPGSSAAPSIGIATVETVAGPLLTLATKGVSCQMARSASICTLEIPAGQVLRRLTLEVEGEGPMGYRLHAPAESRWELLSEGIWQQAGRHLLTGEPKPIAGSILRLELNGVRGRSGPRLKSYVLDLAVPTVVFRAPGAGRYLLAYGGIQGENKPPVNRPPAAAKALWLEPGPEREEVPKPLPGGPGAPLDRVRFTSAWEVVSPNAKPGTLVRLELPAHVYAVAREDLGDLRLAAGGMQVPFFRWSPPAPAFAGGDPTLQPSVSDRPGESRVVISMPSESLPLTQIHLSARPMPLRRRATVLYVDVDRPDRRDSRSGRAAASSTWTCVPEPPLPCRARLDLPGTAPRLLTVRLHDGDNPRLETLGVAVWRRRDVLLFVWPEGREGGVRLLAGARHLEAPRYDLAALGLALLGHPWQPAELRSQGAATAAPWWSRWVMPGGVTIVGAWLVVLLKRILSEA